MHAAILRRLSLGLRPMSSVAAERAGMEQWAAAAETFAGRAAEAERLGQLPDETVAEFIELGVPRMMMPAGWGGQERDLQDVLDMTVALGRGCMSSAWCAAIFAEHPFVLAHFDPATQEEVWGNGPDVIVCMAVFGISQPPVPAQGGYQLTGEWRFVSGCDHAAWFLLVVEMAANDGAEPQRRLFAVPRSDVVIDHDSWQVAGLRATGSKTLTVSGAFVPEHRVLDLAARPAPGITPGMPALFHQPIPATLGHALAAVALGGAEEAFARFRDAVAKRVLRGTGAAQAHDPAAQLDLAEAAVRIEGAWLLLRRSADIARETGRGTLALDAVEMARLRMFKTHVVRQCAEAIDRLFASSGGGALQESNVLQRIWRDVHAVQAHAGLTWSNHARHYGSLAVGLGPTNKQLF
jgi:3-hydroxy-9,10-secoandrosta-1,3,5(10)-triene-9,17-dione monooxygenase